MPMKPLLITAICALSFWAGAIQGDSHMIIDVRTTEEWNSGHLASAQHIELQLVAAQIEQLVPNKSQQLYLYCRSGNRSGQAKTLVESMGYSNVINAGGVADASALLNEDIIK
jgi:phage shock protein E